MKRVMLMVLALLLILSCINITACSCGEDNGTTTSQTTSLTTGSSGGSESWDDVPIYPGAKQVFKMKGDDTSGGKPITLEKRIYETGANANDVAAFYETKMPANGWEQISWMEIQTGFIGQYEKNDGQDNVVIAIASNDKDGGTTISIDKGHFK
jgi:hypothetical protein